MAASLTAPARLYNAALMKSAHGQSAKFVIDPCYSVADIRPRDVRASLFAAAAPSQAAWLYVWGDLESYLLARVRMEGFRDCLNVDHPGRFQKFAQLVRMTRAFGVARVPRRALATIYHSGNLHLSINQRLVLHVEGAAGPVARRVDLAPYLKAGTNQVRVLLNRIDEPPALYIDSAVLRTDESWTVAADFVDRHGPRVAAFVGSGRFPHQERLPVVMLRPRSKPDGLCDFGVELIGMPQVKLRGGSNDRARVQIHPGESVPEATSNDPDAREQIVPALSGAGGQTVTGPRLAFRYLRVQTSGKVRTGAVSAAAEFYPTRYRGAFACSDDRLTRIWMHAAYTLRLCMREFFVDGLKRDRMPWAGDLYLAILCNAFTFADSAIVRRSLVALAGQDPRDCYPNNIIDYAAYWLMSLHLYHRYFDDVAFLRESWEAVERTLERLDRAQDREGLLVAEPTDTVFIDWARIQKRGAVSAVQMLYAMALESAGWIAAACGHAERAEALRRQRRGLLGRIRRLLWDKRQRAFVDNRTGRRLSGAVTRHANFLAVLSGAASAAQTKSLLASVLENPVVEPVGTPYMAMFENMALAQVGHGQRMLDNVRGYWGGMLEQGATSFWEAYDERHEGKQHLAFYGRRFGLSLCHAWAAGPVALLSGSLFGLTPLEPGWRRFTAIPLRTDLAWACATVPTPHGEIRIEVDGNRVELRVPRGVRFDPATGPVRRRRGGEGAVTWCIPSDRWTASWVASV